MKKYTLILLLIFNIISSSKAIDDQNWAVSTIPANLLVKANAIIRNYERKLEISSKGEVDETVNIATTIINENGKNYSYLIEFYDKYSSISGLEGTVFDKNGKKIRKIKYDEFVNFSAISGFSIYEDNRVMFANPKVGDYPYTVVYKYKKKQKSFLVIPGLQVYPGYNISVQKLTYQLILKEGAKINYKGNDKFNFTPVVTELNGSKTISWSTDNQLAIEQEPLSENFIEFSPHLNVAPDEFKMDDYEGSNKSWGDLGNWAFKLLKGKMELPEISNEKIKNMISDKKTDFEKAKILYEYLQGKVRYVSIQVGIGGFQPFSAETVDRLSYGDCKALTNYMKSLLKVAGIKSNYCLVRAGNDSPNIDRNFVCSQFNHAFLMLPLGKDTLYLECTSQQVPFGYNGSFTDDRDILVIDSTNSYIKHTNIYDKTKNNTINSFTFQIGKQMDCNAFQKSAYIGVASENIRTLMDKRPEEQRENILKRFQLSMVKISNLNYVEKKDITPIITETIEYYIPQIAQLTNKSAIIPFNQVTQLKDLKRVSNRKSNIVILRNQIQTDSIKYVIPQDITIEKLPVEGSFSSIFGNYKLKIISANNTITFIRTIEWNKGKFKPEQYTDLLQYQRKINEMDRQVLMLKI